MWHFSDQDGVAVRLSFRPQEKSAVLRFLQRLHGEYHVIEHVLEPRMLAVEVTDQEGFGTCYVPFQLLAVHKEAERVQCEVSYLDSNGEVNRSETYPFVIPPLRPQSTLAIFRPVIGLMMMVAYADAKLTRSEVRGLREFFSSRLELPKPDLREAKELMRIRPSELLLVDLLDSIQYRFPEVPSRAWVALCCDVAMLDGNASAEEISLIKRISDVLREGSDIVADLEAQETPDDPWRVLGLDKGASQDAIKAAWKRRIVEYHPDKYAALPKEFQEVAHQKTLEIQAAYAKLQGTAAQDEEPSNPSPPETNDLRDFGVTAVAWGQLITPIKKTGPVRTPMGQQAPRSSSETGSGFEISVDDVLKGVFIGVLMVLGLEC